MTVRSCRHFGPAVLLQANTWTLLHGCFPGTTEIYRLFTVTNFGAATDVYVGRGTAQAVTGTLWYKPSMPPGTEQPLDDLVLEEFEALWGLAAGHTSVLFAGFGSRLQGVAP